MKLVLSMIVALVLSASAWAFDQSPHCRITVDDGGGVQSCGSGTLVGNFTNCGMVVTCSHLFDDSTRGIVCTFPNGERLPAIIVGRDRAHDLAVLQTPNTKIRGVEFSDPQAAPQRITVCGYGSGNFRTASGAVTGLERCSGATYNHRTAAVAVRSGDSGGGVLDEQGRIVGVIWGCADNRVRFFSDEPFWEIVTKTQCYSGRCYGGVCYPPANQPSRPVRPVNPTPPPIQQPPIVNPTPTPSAPLAPSSTAPPVPPPGCDCKDKWAKLEAWQVKVDAYESRIKKLEATVEAQNTAIAAFNANFATNVANYLEEHPVKLPALPEVQPATLNFLGADNRILATATIEPGETSTVELPPLNIRVQDPRGAGYSTNYQPARLGQYVTLPFGPAQ